MLLVRRDDKYRVMVLSSGYYNRISLKIPSLPLKIYYIYIYIYIYILDATRLRFYAFEGSRGSPYCSQNRTYCVTDI
jgi:hypothetical protein